MTFMPPNVSSILCPYVLAASML